ncbi:hypothetical protein [Pseudonocardia sp. TMWB2A]|uniref:hypothetical protein n=1 Tax=Pseudonocardia sp. TMWB2A TaxID=687430 RepID=UPI00307E71A0
MMAGFGRCRMAWGLGALLALGVGMALPAPQAQLDARTTAKKAAPKKAPAKKAPRRFLPPVKPLPEPMPVRTEQRTIGEDNGRSGLKPPPPVKGEPAIIVTRYGIAPMAPPPPPTPMPRGKEGPQINQMGTLRFAPDLAGLRAQGWAAQENAGTRLMLTVRPDGRVADCTVASRYNSTAFSAAMCKLAVKDAGFTWTTSDKLPDYGYLFINARSDMTPDVDAKLDLMPEGGGLAVTLVLWRDDACTVNLRGLPDDQEKVLCSKVKRTLARRNDFGTNGIALDDHMSEVEIWLRRRPAGAQPTQSIHWQPSFESGFGR